MLADSLLAQEDVPAELYREFMTDIADEIDRENKIITDLLALVKMTRTSADMNVEPMDINALLELLLKRLGPIAARANVKLVFESRRKVNAEAVSYTHLLEQDDMEVDCAYDGEEALDKIKNNKYDLILLDIMLPKLTGLEVCQQVREFSDVPIVMLTAKGLSLIHILGNYNQHNCLGRA